MNANLHPVMQAALAPFVLPPKRTIRFIPLTQYFSYTLAGVSLSCEIEWEAAERGTRDEPGYPANAVLYSAETEGGTDIVEILSAEQISEIETAFLNQQEEY